MGYPTRVGQHATQNRSFSRIPRKNSLEYRHGNRKIIKRWEKELLPVAASEATAKATKPPEFLTVAALAEMMRVSKETVYLWCRSGDVPARQIGGTWRIRRSDVEEMFS